MGLRICNGCRVVGSGLDRYSLSGPRVIDRSAILGGTLFTVLTLFVLLLLTRGDVNLIFGTDVLEAGQARTWCHYALE